jgi:hypothetical protein
VLAGATALATFAVTDETAKSGAHALKITDAAGLPKPFYPYASYSTGEISRGQVTIGFDLKQKAGQSGKLSVEVRDYSAGSAGTYVKGVAFGVTGDGQLLAQGQTLAKLPVGQWSHVELTFTLGEGAPKDYTLAVTLPDNATPTVKLPFASDKFDTMTGLYLVADDDKDAVTYLDNLTLTVK